MTKATAVTDDYAALLTAPETPAPVSAAEHYTLAQAALDEGLGARVEGVQLSRSVPDGAYRLAVVSAGLDKADPADQRSATLLRWEFRILEGTHQGRHLWLTLTLGQGHPVADRMMKEQMELLGLATAREFLAVLPQLSGVQFAARVKSVERENKTYQNVYLNERGNDGLDVPALARQMLLANVLPPAPF